MNGYLFTHFLFKQTKKSLLKTKSRKASDIIFILIYFEHGRKSQGIFLREFLFIQFYVALRIAEQLMF